MMDGSPSHLGTRHASTSAAVAIERHQCPPSATVSSCRYLGTPVGPGDGSCLRLPARHSDRRLSGGRKGTLQASADLPSAPGRAENSTFEAAAVAYHKAKYSERFRYVHDGEKLRSAMEAHYREQSDPGTIRSATVDQVQRLKADRALVFLTVKGNADGQDWTNHLAAAVREKDGACLVDWPATVGMNPVSMRTCRAAKPAGEVVFRVVAEISDYYNFQYIDAKGTHYSGKLEVQNERTGVQGYAKKGSDVGKDLIRLLQDGKPHQITVGVYWNGDGPDAVQITRLVSEDWFAE